MSDLLQMIDFAKKLQSVGKMTFTKEELHEEIHAMAISIHPCSIRNARGRTFKQVYNDCSKTVIERALAVALGGEKNPHKWDYKNPETYRWDVRVGNIYFEIKRHKVGTHWFSYPEDGMKTFRNHAKSLDYLVTAYCETYKDRYEIEFALIADSKTFFNNFKPSRFPNQDSYYDHKAAMKNGECVKINMRQATYPK